MEKAKRRARSVRLRGTVVFAGKRVARAFGHVEDYYVWDGKRVTMPHPSGINHHWNEPRNVRRARRFLRSLA
jgi:hypothetical protein